MAEQNDTKPVMVSRPRSKTLMRHPFVIVTAVLVFLLVVCVLWVYGSVSAKIANGVDPGPGMLSARLMQTTLGLVLGLVFAFLGVILSWFGITGELEGEVAAEAPTGLKTSGKWAKVSPGMALMLCGTIVILASLLKPMAVEPVGNMKTAVPGNEEGASLPGYKVQAQRTRRSTLDDSGLTITFRVSDEKLGEMIQEIANQTGLKEYIANLRDDPQDNPKKKGA